MKKTLAIILTLALVICMMPANAFADGPVLVDLSGATVGLSWTNKTYNGTVQKPEITVSKGGQKIDSENYTVEIKKGETVAEPKEAGNYTVTLQAIEGKSTLNNVSAPNAKFTIDALQLSDTSVQINSNGNIADTYNANANVIIEQSGLTFYLGGYTNPNVFNDSNIKITVTTTDAKTATLKVEGQGNGNITGTKAGIVVKRVAGLKPDNITLLPATSNRTYDGIAKNVQLSGTYKTSTGSTVPLRQGTDFTVTPATVLNVADKSFTIQGIGNYAGVVTATIDYVQAKAVGTTNNYNSVSVSPISTQVKNAQPKVTVTDVINGKVTELKLGTDYGCQIKTDTVGKNAGNAVITFMGNYSGSRTLIFDVVDSTADLSNANVAVDTAGITMYNGRTQTPKKVTVTMGSGPSQKLLTENVDYTLAYQYFENGKTYTVTSPVDAKTYTVVVTGKGNYGGQKIATGFTIPKYNMSYVSVSVSMASPTSAPVVTVKSSFENIYFTKDKDFTVTYSTNTYSGKVFVTVTPASYGNLTGSANSGYYPIVAKSISSCTVSFKDGRSSAAYTGSNIPINLVVKDGYYTTLTQGRDYKVTYKNAAGKVVTAIKDAGTYTIEITGLNGYTGTTYTTFTVTGTDIGNYTVTLKESSVTADGRTKTPVITSVSYGYYSKLSSSDYTVSYQDSTGKEVKSYQMSTPGTYKVVVTGKNGYTGSCYATFTIVGLSQSITGVDGSYKVYPTSETFRLYPKATEGRFTYTSSDPSVASVDAFGNVTPYKAGRAKITISTTGNVRYNPVTTSTVIKVYPNKAAMTRKPWTAGKGKIKVRWNKQDNVTRYEVRYSKNKSFKKGTYKTKKVNAAVNAYTTQSTTLSGLNSGYTYYVKVRAVKEVYNDYGKKLTYYGKWSGWRSVRVK